MSDQRKTATQLPVDDIVLCGLRSKPEWNGRRGSIHGYNEAKARYQVRLDDGSGSGGIVRPANVQLPAGTAVVITGLVNAQQWNSKRGTVLSFEPSSRRYAVRIQEGGRQLKLKLENVLAVAAVAAVDRAPQGVRHGGDCRQ